MKDRHWLFIVTIGLTLIGVIMVFSSSGAYADAHYENSFFFLIKELMWLFVGFLCLLFFYYFNLEIFKKNAPLIFFLAILMVGLTYTPLGVKVGGARRWIRFGGFNFQPSEFLKLGLIIMLSWHISKIDKKISEFLKGFVVGIMIIGVAVAVVLGQPDFGTSFLMGLVGASLLFIGGARIKYLISLFFSTLPLIYYFIIFYPYRLKRVIAFIDPWKDPLGKGFQIVQSFLAIGRGQLTGVGLGESTQKLFYLPAAHTDFIFSIISEELGFIGSVTVIIFFIALMIFCWNIATKTSDKFNFLLTLGCCFYICIQAVFNVAVVTGMVPTKGIPLPFISFGGSSLAVNLSFIGIVMNVSKINDKENLKRKEPKRERQPAKIKFKIPETKIRKSAFL